ncbi:Stress responsive A/B Barrel Domain [Chryseobacterium rhizoplanae]|uniref:Stress responsive A/B Barrel Domain n=1 Tax=Chryseobacterium rhizoplanae TaxID=1609531 RepID=A0A521DPB9_9FLAO|nr:Dabb family protein [Chryseobacterium rhizoplanae]SMO72780.1 Stress responsive A/B Barrel Domain [Chryseobacterium rhizoplanae]
MIDHLVTFQFYNNPLFAKKDRQTLRERGFKSYIMNERAILTDFMISETTEGVYLKVFDEDFDSIKEILQEEKINEKGKLIPDGGDVLWEYCEIVNQYTMSRYKNGSKLFRILCVGILTVLAFSALSCDPKFEVVQPRQRIERLVLIRLKKDLSEEKKEEFLRKITELGSSLKNGKLYLKIEYGFQNSKEGLNAGYDVGIRISFRSYEDRDYFDGKLYESESSILTYRDFKDSLTPYMDPDNELFCFDFLSNEKGKGDVPGKEYRLDHWVLFKFRKDLTEAEKQMVIDRFMELKNSLKNGKPYIQFIEYGYENNKSAANLNFEIAFHLSFLSLEDRNYYVGKPFQNNPKHFDPMHDKFKSFVGSYLDPIGGVLVFDYDVIK